MYQDSKGSDKKAQPRTVQPNVKFSKKLKMEFCHHIYCMSNGAKYAYKRAQNELKIFQDGQSTSDGMITIDKCSCLGHCGKGPNIKVSYPESGEHDVLERMNAFKVGDMMKEHHRMQANAKKDNA